MIVGLSGGIDCALVTAIAVDAAGADNVLGVRMPSQHSSEGSLTDAAELASNLGIACATVPIGKAYGAVRAELLAAADSLHPWGTYPDTTTVAEENLQARLRGTILMTLANKGDALVLNTGNRSEALVGYFTLHGDGVGAVAPIGNLYKTEVYQLAHWYNSARGTTIPTATLQKPPSAELAPGQQDVDSLPPYEQLDAVLQALETGDPAAQLPDVPADIIETTKRLRARAAFKQRYLPPAL